MAGLALAMTAFLLAHAVPARPAVRARLVSAMGRAGYLGLYSVVSLILLAWVVHAYRAAPYGPLIDPMPWMRWVPNLLMPVACVLGVAGLTTRNPFSLGPGGTGFDPQRPGILRLTRQPLPWAFTLWALGHLKANPDAAAALVFGPLLLLSLAAIPGLDRRNRARLGPDWPRLGAKTARPLAAPLETIRETGVARIAGGLILWVLALALHPHVFGVSPLIA